MTPDQNEYVRLFRLADAALKDRDRAVFDQAQTGRQAIVSRLSREELTEAYSHARTPSKVYG